MLADGSGGIEIGSSWEHITFENTGGAGLARREEGDTPFFRKIVGGGRTYPVDGEAYMDEVKRIAMGAEGSRNDKREKLSECD